MGFSRLERLDRSRRREEADYPDSQFAPLSHAFGSHRRVHAERRSCRGGVQAFMSFHLRAMRPKIQSAIAATTPMAANGSHT